MRELELDTAFQESSFWQYPVSQKIAATDQYFTCQWTHSKVVDGQFVSVESILWKSDL